jgi:hypothetical protein
VTARPAREAMVGQQPVRLAVRGETSRSSLWSKDPQRDNLVASRTNGQVIYTSGQSLLLRSLVEFGDLGQTDIDDQYSGRSLPVAVDRRR